MKNINQELTLAEFDKFRQFIESRIGVYIDDSKQKSFKINLNNRLNSLGIKDYGTYYSLITNLQEEKEFDELLNLILIKETYFFRDKSQLHVLPKNILPELIERKKGGEIKIWSAGCASGEEPYSIAMAIMDSFLPSSINVSICATDISKEAVARAKIGNYNKSAMRALDETVINKYFTERHGHYYLNDQVKQCVHFDTENLVKPYFPTERNRFDIIFCKNVIIYFRLETVKIVIRRFYDMLAEGGYLFVGHSESLWQISEDFELEEIGGVFLYRKNGKANNYFPAKEFDKKTKGINSNISTSFSPPSRYYNYSGGLIPSSQRLAWISDNLSKNISQVRNATIDKQISSLGEVVNKAVVTKFIKKEVFKEAYYKKDISELIKKISEFSGDGDFVVLLEDIEKLLQEYPDNVNFHLLAGKLCANIGLYDKAFKKGMDVLEINDLCADAYLLIGSIYYRVGEKEKAASALKKAIYLDDKSVLSHYYLGNLYKNSNLIKQAIQEYSNVIDIFKKNLESTECLVGEVFTVKQLKEICVRNIEILVANQQMGRTRRVTLSV